MKNKIYAIIFVVILVFTLIFNKEIKTSVEEQQIPLGVGVDLKSNEFNDIYDVTVSTYVFEANEKILSKTREGSGITSGSARQNRQLKEDKQYLIGQEKVFIIGEDYARYGMKGYFDFVFRNNSINDKANVVICEGTASSLIKFKIENYINSVDFIDGMVNIINLQHFSSEEYKAIDVYTRINSKYRNLVLPYISISNDKIQIKGYALFNEDKMKIIADNTEGKIINILREDSGYGIVTIFNGQDKSLDLYGKGKRKVSCIKEQDNYHFTITLNLKMSILTNEFDKKLSSDRKVKKELQLLAEKQLEDQCREFIDKMQNNYKVDYLDLKRVLVAKYGSNLDVDLNQIICNSKIDVKAKINIVNYGRGDY